MSTSLRERIVKNTVITLQEIADPAVVLVTREPFDVEKLAITQFPALLVNFNTELRESVSMGAVAQGRRTGTIVLDIRGFVRGTEIDTLRNKLIAAVEDALDLDRDLGLKSAGVLGSQITEITVVPRLAPLGEIGLRYEITYNYLRGSQA
jgi:hypothetical protein